MKLVFLGTGAADWDITRPKKDGEFRRFSSVLVDGRLLIDPGPCVLEAAGTFGVDLSSVKYILNTHDHDDHLHRPTLSRLMERGARFLPFSAGEVRRIGGYVIEAVQANHGTCPDAVHFLIDDGEKRFFYGLDGAWLLYPEIEAIKKRYVDLIVLDGTIGDIADDYRIFEHNNLIMVEEMKKSLASYAGRFMISHMARTLHTDHRTLVRRMLSSGIEVAYDGLATEL